MGVDDGGLRYSSPHVAEVHALDISPEMLKIGRRKAPSVDIFGKDTLLADMREVGFVNASTPDVGAKK